MDKITVSYKAGQTLFGHVKQTKSVAKARVVLEYCKECGVYAKKCQPVRQS